MLRDYLQLPRLVHILCLGSLLNKAGSFVIIFLTIYASEKLGFGVPFATACMGVFGLGAMLGSILGGQLADQVGRRFVMLVSLFGGAMMLLVLGSIENRWAFMATVGAFATIIEMYRPAATAMIADAVVIDRRPHAFSLMYISINLGFAVAPALGGALAEYSYDWLFWGDAITMTFYGLIITVFVRETLPRQAGDKSIDSKKAASDQVPISTAIVRIAGDTSFLVFCMGSFLTALVFMQCVSTLPLYIRECGFSNAEYGLMMSINGILIFVVQLPLTHWLNRYNVMSLIVAGGVLIAIGFGSLGMGNTFLFFAAMVTIWTFGEMLQFPFKNALVTDIAPVDLRARYAGLFGMMFGLALTIGAPLGGQALLLVGAEKFWLATFAVSTSAVVMFAAIRRPITARVLAAELVDRDQKTKT